MANLIFWGILGIIIIIILYYFDFTIKSVDITNGIIVTRNNIL